MQAFAPALNAHARTPRQPARSLPLQAKRTVSQPGDDSERQADNIAEQVMRMPEPAPAPPCACGGGCPRCQASPPLRSEALQAKRVVPAATPSPALPASVGDALGSAGQPLDGSTRSFMEPRFGRDFSQVRVHTDATARQSAADIDARAYTVGGHVVFGAGQFAPHTQDGRQLIAHELAHVQQQDGAAAGFSPSAKVHRAPAPPKATDPSGCDIKNPRAYVYFELSRRFKNENDDDPAVVKRANCLKVAFSRLEPKEAIEFAQSIVKRDRKDLIYASFENLATPTRMALAQILVDVIQRKDTDAYLARVLFAAAVTPYDDPKIDKPAIVTANVHGGDLLQITLDKHVMALAGARVFGNADCDKYTFGFAQFVTDDNFVTEFYNSKSGNYIVMDASLAIRKSLPCHDVFNDGDVWSYAAKLDCAAKDAEKTIPEEHSLGFTDAPSEGTITMKGQPDWTMSAITWTDKFINVFSVMLPNGVVHHLSWFRWSIEYCENFPLNRVGKPPLSPKDRKVTIGTMASGDPPAPYAAMVGKPAPKACNNIVHEAKPTVTVLDSPVVKCG